MPGRSAATTMGGMAAAVERPAEPEALHREGVVPLVDLLASEGGTQESDHVARPLVGLVEGDAVPPLDDDVRRCADAEGEPAGAASAMAATLIAMRPGPRVKAGTIAEPRRSDGVHAAARASGVNASVPPASLDQRSV